MTEYLSNKYNDFPERSSSAQERKTHLLHDGGWAELTTVYNLSSTG